MIRMTSSTGHFTMFQAWKAIMGMPMNSPMRWLASPPRMIMPIASSTTAVMSTVSPNTMVRNHRKGRPSRVS